jgi:transcriptional regulator with PAS, ATPase and Fis domain
MGTVGVRRVDVRIVSATNADLEKRVEEGEFRLDLYYRLDVLAVRAPPLRERISDIPELIDHFFGVRGRPSPVLHEDALGILMRHPWPGNVRELDNEIERLVVLHPQAPEITPAMLSDRVTRRSQTDLFDVNLLCESPLSRAVGYLEENLLRKTLVRTNWNKSQTARELGLSRQGLLKKIKRYGIVREQAAAD